ncbi:hypothetical protein L249_7978 [Ophiocordyceps polyrhachis-furcata BCC 54312]|uniref:Uncharacterized protein n=1 Tax=Ophiocordyceps polyrhachis-furcata BCC 54312 TaxID=1330021 RepID=A0A367LH03_9HYPO|nr:hypothetical protein L249_7978 [Ophiocordyceps polyrhachis-furcata BCC 54312]
MECWNALIDDAKAPPAPFRVGTLRARGKQLWVHIKALRHHSGGSFIRWKNRIKQTVASRRLEPWRASKLAPRRMFVARQRRIEARYACTKGRETCKDFKFIVLMVDWGRLGRRTTNPSFESFLRLTLLAMFVQHMCLPDESGCYLDKQSDTVQCNSPWAMGFTR